LTTQQPIAEGRIESLSINKEPVDHIVFRIDGPYGDTHAGMTRALSGHDGDYIGTSSLEKGAKVFNWRQWTALACEETAEVEEVLGVPIPPGCIKENIRFRGIPNYSKLATGSRLVFPLRDTPVAKTQVILTVWEENRPCRTAGEEIANEYKRPELTAQFVKAARGKRGNMGFVLSAGYVRVYDRVLVYPPVR
jgi:MOSC domain-containing protein YiiM